jgi:hypothetical protein
MPSHPIATWMTPCSSRKLQLPGTSKFVRAAHEFAVYISANAGSLINYGERFRSGERISSCLAESTVNAVTSKRFAKRQQMQWTKRGAHLLLQTRTRALDGTLRPLFERWHPGLAVNDGGDDVPGPVAGWAGARVNENFGSAGREQDPASAAVRGITGISPRDIQEQGILGGQNSEARKVARIFGIGG